MRGTIVIGEAERDEAPCSTLARKSVRSFPTERKFRRSTSPSIPSKARTCAPLAPGSITGFGCSLRARGLLHAQTLYGENCRRTVVQRCGQLDAPIADNLKNIAKRLDRDVEDLS